jgi:hypothetical protein
VARFGGATTEGPQEGSSVAGEGVVGEGVVGEGVVGEGVVGEGVVGEGDVGEGDRAGCFDGESFIGSPVLDVEGVVARSAVNDTRVPPATVPAPSKLRAARDRAMMASGAVAFDSAGTMP